MKNKEARKSKKSQEGEKEMKYTMAFHAEGKKYLNITYFQSKSPFCITTPQLYGDLDQTGHHKTPQPRGFSKVPFLEFNQSIVSPLASGDNHCRTRYLKPCG